MNELFDTSAVSYVLNERDLTSRLARRLDKARCENRAYISDMTAFELRRGVAKLNRRGEGKQKKLEVEEMISKLQSLPLNEPVFEASTELWVEGQMRKPAILISDADLFVAGTAAAQKMLLVTTDQRLADRLQELQPELRVETS